MSPEVVDRKTKMKLPPQPVPKRPVNERISDFEITKLSYTEEQAIAEASRCLLCPKEACVVACPLHNDIPSAMRLISEGKFIDAAEVYNVTSTLPEICSRVCPQDDLCEGACVLGKRGQPVALGALERFVTDYVRVNRKVTVPNPVPSTGKQVAIVGAGPAGLSVAQRLLEKGHAVTLYEALPAAGGWLMYAIPTYKLPRSIVHQKVESLEHMGARFIYNTQVGNEVSLADLRERFDAVFIGVGAMHDAHIEIDGRDIPGIYTGTEFLQPTYVPEHLRPPNSVIPYIGKHVAVFGGGDTAIDCVRTAVRLQTLRGWEPKVTLIYRRTENEMPASMRERQAAKEEGVEFVMLAAPTAFSVGPDGKLSAVTIQRMELGEPDSSGRRRPVPIEGDTYVLPVDVAVLALGYWPDPLISEHAPELETHKWGLVVTDEETGATNLSGVFSGGDAVRGPDLVSRAVRDGIIAARAIHAYLTETQPEFAN